MSASAGVFRGGTTILPGIEVRVLNSEMHGFSTQATRYGVESGKSISDHIILNPVQLEVSFGMTNTDRGSEAARDVFQQIVKIMNDREVITVETEHARYKNMVITGFNPEHRSPNRGAFVGSIQLTEVGVIGQGNNVSPTGGRNEFVLAPDSTSKTASNYIYGGQQLPNTDRALNKKVIESLI